MRKLWISLVAMLLLMTMIVPAVADVNPGQMGDQGGAFAAEIAKMHEQNRQSSGSYIQAPYTETPSQSQQIIYVPDASTGADNGGYGMDDEIPWINNEVPGQTGGVVTLPGEINTETPSTGSSSGGTQSLDWFNGGYEAINANKSITVYDVNTGITWGALYINGKNHADVVPASKADADKIESNKITGSYVRRPVVVTIGGVKYAGSMYAVGHGSTNYVSYYSGVMCIHFTGSQTHGSKKVDSDHQNAIQEALKY